MRYRASKKMSHRRLQDPHQKQYVLLPFGGGHNTSILQHSMIRIVHIVQFTAWPLVRVFTKNSKPTITNTLFVGQTLIIGCVCA